jgi:hypothetical protein
MVRQHGLKEYVIQAICDIPCSVVVVALYHGQVKQCVVSTEGV